MSRGWPGRSRYGGGPEALQKVGLSLKDDGAAGTRPGNGNPLRWGLARSLGLEAAYGHFAAWCGLGPAASPASPLAGFCLSSRQFRSLARNLSRVTSGPTLLLPPAGAGFVDKIPFPFQANVERTPSVSLGAGPGTGLGWGGGKLAPGALLPEGWLGSIFDQRLQDLHNGGASLRGECCFWFCFCFFVSRWREGRIGVFNTNFYFGDRLCNPRCFSRPVNFLLDNDFRRELQGPVLRCKHLLKGRGWKRQVGFFPWPMMGIRSVLLYVFIRRSGNERQIMIFPSVPHQGMFWCKVLHWFGRNPIGF